MVREADMSGLAKVNARLEEVVTMLGRAVEAALLAIFVVIVLCGIGLVVAGTYGMLHKGDDFGFGNSRGGGGDVIVPSGVL
jgi:hypothetical protein